MNHREIEMDWTKRWALYSPDAVALHCLDTNLKITYLQLYRANCRLAHELVRCHQIAEGDRVAILAQNSLQAIVLFFALQRLGAILVPLNFRLASREIAQLLVDCKPKLLIYHPQFAESISQCTKANASILWSFNDLAKIIANSIASAAKKETEVVAFHGKETSANLILYTSGTTGTPKGVVLTNRMIFWNSINTGLRLNLTQKDSYICFHPQFHTSGWNVLTTPLLHHGGKILLLQKFEPKSVLTSCEREKVSIFFGVPTMMSMLSLSDRFAEANLSSVRFAIVGGEPMPIPQIEIWERKGISIRQGYGLTEFGPNVFSLNAEDSIRKIGSIGFANFYIDVKIMDMGSGKEVTEPNVVGELLLRGPCEASGYWQNPEATHQLKMEHWVRTGDLVRRDPDGYFYVVGRRKEMFISGGENVYPAEVEKYLQTYPGLRELAVVGVADEKWGEVGCCYYSSISNTPIDPKVLRSFCENGLARYKIPKHFVHLSELPKSDSGKIIKRVLTETFSP